MMRPLLFLFGSVRMSVEDAKASVVVYLLGRRGVVYRNTEFSEGRFFFECSLFSYRKARSILNAHGVDARIEKTYGIPTLTYRYRHRYGILIGAILFAAVLVLSGRVVWDVRVEGNQRISEEEVEEALRECGFGVGSVISRVHTPTLETEVLIASEDIAWISVNFIGNVAQVSIRETLPYDETENYDASDLIATHDGVIQWLEEAKGNILVKEGDTVKAGDVLVSGLYPEDENTGARYTVSKGKVFARTERQFEVGIPLKYDKKSYTGREKRDIYIILFEKEIKIFGKGGNSYSKCDTINTEEYVCLPKNILLPFGIRTVRYLEYETVEATRDEEAAIELALYTLRCQMESEPNEGTLVSKQLSGEITDDGYLLRCTAGYIENIAAVRELKIEN